ncbi:MAG: pilus assembly PilX N-terminal domain-containing protein [Lysobacterales bacterium]
MNNGNGLSASRPVSRCSFGLIFLLITLVAVTAMRGTSLELNMAANTANHEEAFGAESGRMAFVRVIRDVACNFNLRRAH